MDRGWHHTTYSGPERPRLGQQPYDRGRASNDRRGCYECGHEGHILKYCPKLDNRYYDSGRFAERSTGLGNGRWSHDSWSSSRIASGKEHGYSRTEGVRDGSNRRSHFDYHDSGDFLHKARDSGDRHRDNEGRANGIGTASNANARERDTKSSRSSSRKPLDQNYGPGRGYRGEERRENRGKECELNSGKVAANGDVPDHVDPGGEELRDQPAVQEGRPASKLPISDVELATNGSLAGVEGAFSASSLEGLVAQQIAESPKELQVAAPENNRCQISEKGVERDQESTVDSVTRSRVPNKLPSKSKPPLSVLCEDAAEGNLENRHKIDNSVVSSVSESAFVGEPAMLSSAEKMHVQDCCSGGQRDIKLESPCVPQDNEGSVNIENCETVNCPDHERHNGDECTKDTNGGDGTLVPEHSEEADVQGLIGIDDSHCKSEDGLLVPTRDNGREEDQAMDSDRDEHIAEEVRDFALGVAPNFERVLLPSDREPAEQGPEDQLTDLGFVQDGQSESHVDRDVLFQHSDDDTAGRIKGRGSFLERDSDTECHRRGLEPAYPSRDGDSHGHGWESEPYQRCVAPDGIREKDCQRQHPENINSSYLETPRKVRSRSKERDSTHIGLGSRECSVDRISDRDGYTRYYYERSGLKDGYRRRDCDGYDRSGGRNSSVNWSDFRWGEDCRERRGWGADWRHSRHWEAYPGHSDYRPGSYVSVCNARFLQQRRLSPLALSPPARAVVPLDPYIFSTPTEEVNDSIKESQSKGWIFHDALGILRGPMTLGQLKDLVDRGELQPDYLVQLEGSNEWVSLEHADSHLISNLMPSLIEHRQYSATRSPRLCEVSVQLREPICQEPFQQEHYNPENEDLDICPPGTEGCLSGGVDENCEDFHIDERVEKLMDGITLIPGKEKEIVHDTLSSAARLVLQEYELEFGSEGETMTIMLSRNESPRSHGGFADLGDQWKDGDFGSDVQGLGGFGFEQQATKVDVKVEEAGMEAGSGCRTEVVSAPKPASALKCSAESKQESWKWPSRGGDWKVVYVVGEAHGSIEKGHSGYPRKVVMNEGHPLCGSKNPNLRDPRRQNQDGKANVAESASRLQVPKFAHKTLLAKVEGSSEDHHIVHNQHSVTTPKGTNATTPKSQGSTPRAHLSTPVKGRSVSAVLGSGVKMDKSGKNSSSQGMVHGSGSKSICQVKQQQLLSKGSKVGNLVKREVPVAKRNVATVDACEPPPLQVGLVDGQLKLALEHDIENIDRKSKQSFPGGPMENSSPLARQQQEVDLDVLKYVNAPSSNISFPPKEDLALKEGFWYYLDGKGHEVGPFGLAQLQALVANGNGMLLEGSSLYLKADGTWAPLTESPPEDSVASRGELVTSAEDTFSRLSKDGGTGSSSIVLSDVISLLDNHPQFLGFTRGKPHEFIMRSYRAVFSRPPNEGSDKWLQTKEQEKLSVITTPTASVGPETCQRERFAREDTSQHQKQLRDQSMLRASSSLRETLLHSVDDGSRMMEIEECIVPASGLQDAIHEAGESCPSKRKVCSMEDGVASKQHRKSIQRRRLLDYEGNDSDRKLVHSSHVTRAVHSTMPLLIDDNPTKPSEVDFPKTQEQGNFWVPEQNWAALKPSLLRTVFRCLRGDVKTLVNAMAACKSWLAAGKICKMELKQADLSSVQGHSLDAVLESLPAFGGGKLRRIILKGCAVSPDSLGHLLRACPSISAVEIGCNEPLKELIRRFPKVRWLGERNGVQSHKERLTRKREDSHLKMRSLKVISEGRDGLRESLSKDVDESDTHPLNDSFRSPDGYTCLPNMDVETLLNDSVQDSEITHLTRGPNDGVKHLKLNDGGSVIRRNGVNGPVKTVKQEHGSSISRSQLKRKVLTASSQRKYEKAAYRMSKPGTGSHRALADKHSSTSVKMEHHPKTMGLSVSEGDKSLEREMATLLRLMMEADTNKCFQSANIIATDGKGVSSVSVKPLDLSMIEKKLKGGAYAGGKDGFKVFKEDVNLLTRNAFRNEKDRAPFLAAEKIFKLSHQHFKSVESQFSGTSPADPHSQGKLFGVRPFNKAGKGRLKNISMLQHRPGNKRKSWDDDGVHKGKFGAVKKGRHGDSSSGDVDSNSDSTENETQRFSKLKKEQWWEYEGDSSEEDEENGFMEEDEEETETEASDSDVPSESEGEDGICEDDNYDTEDEQFGYHDWGARMTRAAMVPPVTRKYKVIEEYRIVADKERVEQKMKVELPEDYEEKIKAAKDKRGDSYSHLDIPEIKDYRPRKKLGEEVLEQEVYGIDPYTHNLLLDTMPEEISGFSESQKQQFIEERLLLALNREARQYMGSGKAPMAYSLETVVERIQREAEIVKDWALHDFSEQLLNNMRNRPKDKFVAYRKGLGVVCNKHNGLEKDEFVVEFFGEVYPPWRWYEKQDGIRFLQKKDKDTTPEFYNIFYERPKGDAAGYDLLVVDAMHKANFASRLCHSCRPNCEAKITAVNNTYIIGVYTLKHIKRGEELTFDYNSVTESKEEYNNAVCLCGSQGCRGSYLNLTGSGTFEEVIIKHHGLLDRHRLLLESCVPSFVTDEEWKEMRQAGLGACLLSGLPDWVLKYAARLVHFMNFEKIHLPAELLKDFDLKRKKGIIEGCTEVDAEITTEGVYNQRLQNLAITLDKVRHILTKLYRNPSSAPPPLRKLDQKDIVQWIWKRDDSLLNELLQCLGPHLTKDALLDLKQGISKHGPHDSGSNLKECLLWLRDELRRLPATCMARHDAAADLVHVYAYTKCFFTMEDYAVVESSQMEILPLDLGSSRHSISGPRAWHKTYSKEYVWGQLINWYKQNVADPGASLAKASRGCLMLPDLSSCYAKSMQHDFRQGYGQKHREKMIWHMEEKPQQKWPKSKFWSEFWCFKNERGLFGSPMLDSVIEDGPLDDQMVQWLKIREDVFVGPWDEQ